MAEKEYIERGALMVKLVRKFYPVIPTGSIAEHFCTAILDTINNQCSADVVEVRHGKWEEIEIPEEKYVCSVCGGACWYYDYQGELAKSRFYPNCGAKMDGGVVE